MANGHGGERPGGGGKQPGSGRPPKDITKLRQEYQKRCLREWTTPEDLQYIWQMTLGLAKRGDAGARADVFKYLLGNPVQPIEMTGDQRLVIEYSNDWRGENRPALSASGASGGALPSPALPLAECRPEVAEDHPDDGG